MSRFICNTKDLDNYIGHYIAQEVYDAKCRLLVNTNYKIDNKTSIALQKHEVYCVLISEEKIKKEPVSIELRQAKTIEYRKTKLRNAFDDVRKEILSNKKRAFRPSVLLSQETLKKVEKAVDSILESIMSNPFIAVNLMPLEKDSDFLIRHSVNVCYLGLCFVSSYKQIFDILRHPEKGMSRFEGRRNTNSPSDLVSFGIGCFLHDIGKFPMLDVVNLDITYENKNKVWDTIKNHPAIGHEMLFGKNINAHALLGIKFHHENYDGSGYPYGISDYKIHPYSRIIRILDSFDAGMTKRPGREEKPFTDMLSEILSLSGSHYDPEFVRLFIDMMLCGKSGLVGGFGN